MRNTLLVSALIVTASLALHGCATSEKSLQDRGLTPLTHSALVALKSRTRTTRWTNSQNVTGTGTYRPNGTAALAWAGGGTEGAWRIAGDKLCTKYSSVRGGNEACFTVYKTGENEYQAFFPDGTFYATFSYTN